MSHWQVGWKASCNNYMQKHINPPTSRFDYPPVFYELRGCAGLTAQQSRCSFLFPHFLSSSHYCLDPTIHRSQPHASMFTIDASSANTNNFKDINMASSQHSDTSLVDDEDLSSTASDVSEFLDRRRQSAKLLDAYELSSENDRTKIVLQAVLEYLPVLGSMRMMGDIIECNGDGDKYRQLADSFVDSVLKPSVFTSALSLRYSEEHELTFYVPQRSATLPCTHRVNPVANSPTSARYREPHGPRRLLVEVRAVGPQEGVPATRRRMLRRDRKRGPPRAARRACRPGRS